MHQLNINTNIDCDDYNQYKNDNLNCKDYHQIIIGEFDQISDKMFVSDPSYQHDPNEHKPDPQNPNYVFYNNILNIVINNVLSGQWLMMLLIKTCIKERNAELVCIHDSIKGIYSNTDPWKEVGENRCRFRTSWNL